MTFELSPDKVQNAKEQLQYLYPQKIALITPDHQAAWGKMTAQHMIEHLAASLTSLMIRYQRELTIPTEPQQKARNFLILNDNDFPKSLQNPMFQYGLPPYLYANINEAKQNLIEKLRLFFEMYDSNPTLIAYTPFFGDLDYPMLIFLNYKHFKHHLMQFGLL